MVTEKSILDICVEQIELRKQVAEMQKRIKQNNELLKAYAKGKDEYLVGNYWVYLKAATTSSIDKTRLAADHGKDFVEHYTKVTEYTKVDIKKAA